MKRGNVLSKSGLVCSVTLSFGLLAALGGCSHAPESASASTQPGETSEQAVSRVQADKSLNPEQKVKQIDSLQKANPPSGGQKRHKKEMEADL